MTRRDCLTAGAGLLWASCGRRKGSGYPGYALIATAGENSLAVVDLTEFRLLKTIPLGAPPTTVVPAPAINRNFVLTPSTDSVHIVGGNLTLSGTHRLGAGITGIRLSPDNRSLLAISRPAKELIIAETGSLRVTRRIKLTAEPTDLAVAPNGYVAVSTGAPGTVELIQPATGITVRTQFAGAAGAVLFRKDGQLLLVARPQDRSIAALDVPTLRVVAELPLAMQPDNLCFNFDEGQLFVSGAGMDGVAIVFPYNTLEVDQTVLAGRDPGVMACSENPSYLFVASASGSDVCILNVDNRKVIGLVDVGAKPGYIAITPDNQYALILGADSGDMAVIQIPSIRVNREKTGASLFTVVDVGSQPVHAAVIARQG